MSVTDTLPFAAPCIDDICRTRPETRRAERVETTVVRLEGALQLEASALPRLLRVLDGRPRLAALARAINGRLTFAENPIRVSVTQWATLDLGIQLCAGLAFEGVIVVHGEGGWQKRIPASGAPPQRCVRDTLTGLTVRVPRPVGRKR